MAAISDIIMQRKSVRTYDGQGLKDEDRKRILEYIETIENPYGIPITFQLLDAKEFGLSSPVLSGEQLYVAAKVEKVPHAEEAFGYSFEKLVLYAWSLGIGTVWIGGTMNRSVFENAVGLKENEMMPCVSPLGYPAKKRSVRESLMRKGVKADDRMRFEDLFFEESLETPLTVQKAKDAANALELVRWAPSAVNKQPWRVIAKGDTYHFYEKKDKGYVSDAAGDLQKIDVGIALCHFMLGLEAEQKTAEFVLSDPDIEIRPDMEYIASVRIRTQS